MSIPYLSVTLLVLSLAILALSQEYLIIPERQSSCDTNSVCVTLDQFAQTNPRDGSDLTLIFQPGQHTLSQPLSIQNFTYVQMVGQNNAVLSLYRESWVELSEINQLSIKGLIFTGLARGYFSLPDSHSLNISNTQKILINSCYFTSLDTAVYHNKTETDHEYGTIAFIGNSEDVAIENVVFDSNNGTALAITESKGMVSIKNSTFIGNQGLEGGAVYIDSVSTLVINYSVFTGNQAASRGGALFITSYDASGEVYISNCYFTSNTAKLSGGGINVASGSMAVYHTVLMSNTADYGGGIEVYWGNASISNCNLTGNTAKRDGGGIDVYQLSNVSVSNSNLTGNKAERDGGGIEVNGGYASMSNNNLTNNTAERHGGGIDVYRGNSFISNCSFINNTAKWHGGGLDVYQGYASICNCNWTGNNAVYGGGILVSESNISILNCTLMGNTAENNGGGILVRLGNASIHHCKLTDNTADYGGGIFVYRGIYVSVSNCDLRGNTAKQHGGGIHTNLGNASINDCHLIGNTAEREGGGIDVYQGDATISNCNLLGNVASNFGSAINVAGSPSLGISDTCIMNSSGKSSVYFSECLNVTFWGENTISNNSGSVYLFHSRLHFNGPTSINSNHGQYAGAIAAVLSHIYLFSVLTISNNTASEYGGGLFLQDSSLFINSPVIISHNTAGQGGAIYAYQSSIEFQNAGYLTFPTFAHNYANNGGGIYAIGSVIVITQSYISIESNKAKANGGGLYLQRNTRLYILKRYADNRTSLESKLNISNNYAQLGGGIYVDDRTTGSGACRSGVVNTGFLGECFIQTFLEYWDFASVNTENTFIANNNATRSGSAIYGGLLDRCTPARSFVEVHNAASGLEYIQQTVKLDEKLISSEPLQLKLCSDHSSIFVKKGHSFIVNVRAIDQIGNSVNATIYGAVVTENGVGRLKEGQTEQRVGRECTESVYNVFAESKSAQLELYALGPCNDLGLSKLTLNITFLNCTCTLGFHPSTSNIECSCECDLELQAAGCFPEEEIFQLDNTLWIGTANFTDCNSTRYLVHDCPFDYCVNQPVNVSLNSTQHIDKQCAYNRSGVLCGECKEGLSLVLASSKCKECSNTYLLLLIPFALAGITLVLFILWLNVTIATGTVHGLIVYANILAANKPIFLPFSDSNFLTVFILWVNLDLGIETCFYNGMNSQVKVLLQLVFPAYLFLLVFLIILMSKHINCFANALSNRNPVAALCTLLILSYSKLLRLIISALHFTFLDCSNLIVWLYDGNVQYFSISHIPRFVAASVILIACVLFTTLLFFGQWFPRCSKWKVMKWTKNTKYIGFMDVFHAPFTPKHRYWPGLLLFALIAHNLATSMAPDTSIPILSAGCISGGLNGYRFLVNRVYKNKFNGALETIFLLNVCMLTFGTATTNSSTGQLALAYVSMAVSFILFVVITCYHFHKYVLKKTSVWNNHLVKPLNQARGINCNILLCRNYRRLDNNFETDTELPSVDINYSYEPREETDSDKYITPPIITPATRLDQLREPDLDVLAPVTEIDYTEASPDPTAPTCNHLRPVVTRTFVKISKD